MKRHIATALIAGIGLAAPAAQVAGASQPSEALHPVERLDKRAICRLSQFGHLKSAGRFRRNEIAKVFVDEGMLFAEWSGQVNASQPRRIETEEIDAEWMAHCVDGRWLLSRRELAPSGGKMWSVQIYGQAENTSNVRMAATCIDVEASAGREVFTVNFVQSGQSAQVMVRGNRDGRVMRGWSAAGESLADLRERHPIIAATYLEPALGKVVC
jgi:hypothetical protein